MGIETFESNKKHILESPEHSGESDRHVEAAMASEEPWPTEDNRYDNEEGIAIEAQNSTNAHSLTPQEAPHETSDRSETGSYPSVGAKSARRPRPRTRLKSTSHRNPQKREISVLARKAKQEAAGTLKKAAVYLGEASSDPHFIATTNALGMMAGSPMLLDRNFNNELGSRELLEPKSKTITNAEIDKVDDLDAEEIAMQRATNLLMAHETSVTDELSQSLVQQIGFAALQYVKVEGENLLTKPDKKLATTPSETNRLIQKRAAEKAVSDHIKPQSYEESVNELAKLLDIKLVVPLPSSEEDDAHVVYHLTDKGAKKVINFNNNLTDRNKKPRTTHDLDDDPQQDPSTTPIANTYAFTDTVHGGGKLVTMENHTINVNPKYKELGSFVTLGVISLTPEGNSAAKDGATPNLQLAAEVYGIADAFEKGELSDTHAAQERLAELGFPVEKLDLSTTGVLKAHMRRLSAPLLDSRNVVQQNQNMQRAAGVRHSFKELELKNDILVQGLEPTNTDKI